MSESALQDDDKGTALPANERHWKHRRGMNADVNGGGNEDDGDDGVMVEGRK